MTSAGELLAGAGITACGGTGEKRDDSGWLNCYRITVPGAVGLEARRLASLKS